jgi:hypothetical protein
MNRYFMPTLLQLREADVVVLAVIHKRRDFRPQMIDQ